ncbi:Uncharacterized protein GBIM_18481 [Gryllus bimaculatus]|nr:Uncharacterized protein GBIM_18481 [Gryllus bimaculatus]
MCGQTIRENCTYFVNPGYPGPFDGTGSCQLTIQKSHPDICQFRLDFDTMTIAGPEPVNNVCTNDQFIVSGGNPVPAICGINNGNHMNNRTHAFTLSDNTLSREATVSSRVSSMGAFSCNNDWLGVPCASNVGRRNTSTCVDRICGGTLNADVSTVPSAIYSTVKPFRLSFHTDALEAPADVGNRGFCLNYVQQPCTNNL